MPVASLHGKPRAIGTKENQAKLDDLYDRLVHLRDKMGKKLGYEGYTTLGYYRMGRNCYQGRCREVSQGGCEVFGACGGQHLSRAGEAFGQKYPMSFADNALEFRSGNPKPIGTPDEDPCHGSQVL